MKIKLFVFLLVVLLGCAAVYSVTTFVPEVAAIHSMHGVADDFANRAEIKPLKKMLKQGSLEASVSEVNQNGENLIEGESVSGKMYFSKNVFSKDEFMLKDFELLTDELQIHGDVYSSNDLFYISEDHILGGAYGIVPESFTADLRDSIFAADSGSKYAIPDEDFYDLLMESSDPLEFENMKKDAEKILKQYERKLWIIVCQNANITSVSKYVDFEGTKKPVRVIAIEIEPYELANIIEEFFEFVEDDDSVVKFIDEYESMLLPCIEYVYGPIEQNSLSTAYEKMIDTVEDYVDVTCDELTEIEDGLLEIELVTPKFSNKMLRLTVKSDGEKLIVIDFGEKGIQKTEKISISIKDSETVYEVQTKHDTKRIATLTVNGEQAFAITVNNVRETFQIDFGDCTVSGSMKVSEDKTVFTFDTVSITSDSDTIEEYTTNLQITFREKDEMPDTPTTYGKISDITEKDVDGWLKKLENIDSEDS